MMQINPVALERVATSNMSGKGTAEIFAMLAAAAQLAPSGSSGSFTLSFQQPGDPIQPGELFPYITLTLAPAAIHESDHPTGDGPAQGTTGEQPVP